MLHNKGDQGEQQFHMKQFHLFQSAFEIKLFQTNKNEFSKPKT